MGGARRIKSNYNLYRMCEEKEIGQLVRIVEDVEAKMDQAMYGIKHTFHVFMNIKLAGGVDEAMEKVKQILGNMIEEGSPVEADVTENGNVMKGTIRVFNTAEGLKLWQNDAELREVENRAKGGRW